MIVHTLLNAVTATGAGPGKQSFELEQDTDNRTFQVWGTTTAGAGAATVTIEVSNDASNWITLSTITLTLSTSAANDGFASGSPWPYTRANCTAISGTGASVTATMGF